MCQNTFAVCVWNCWAPCTRSEVLARFVVAPAKLPTGMDSISWVWFNTDFCFFFVFFLPFRRQAHLCVLASNCDEPSYVRLVEALCAEHQIKLLKVCI